MLELTTNVYVDASGWVTVIEYGPSQPGKNFAVHRSHVFVFMPAISCGKHHQIPYLVLRVWCPHLSA